MLSEGLAGFGTPLPEIGKSAPLPDFKLALAMRSALVGMSVAPVRTIYAG